MPLGSQNFDPLGLVVKLLEKTESLIEQVLKLEQRMDYIVYEILRKLVKYVIVPILIAVVVFLIQQIITAKLL